jgi:hypothetical protein
MHKLINKNYQKILDIYSKDKPDFLVYIPGIGQVFIDV